MRMAPLLLALALAGPLPCGEPLSLPRALRLAGEQSLSAETARANLAGAREETAQVQGLIGAAVTRQSFLMGFVDAFGFLVVVFLLTPPFVPTLRNPQGGGLSLH